MRVLGITTEGDGGAVVAEDGRVLAAVNEERLCRLKLVVGFPRGAIREVLRLAQTTVDELDAVVVASERATFVDELEPFDGWFQHSPHGFADFLRQSVASKFARYGNSLPILQSAYYALLTPSFWNRRRVIRRILRDEFRVRLPIKFIDHHFAHVASAYFTGGFRDALAVSIDGGGDGRSALVCAVRNGRFEYLHEVSAYNSLGNYYAYVTHICGFKAQKHEGKITGLAAHGEPKYLPLLEEFITFEDGSFRNRGGVVFQGAIAELRRRLPAGWTREDLSASIQRHCEDLARRFVQHWARRSGLHDVAMAGGVFANVRVNQEVHALPEVDRVFIHPHMGDGGMSAGAALAASVPGVIEKTMPTTLESIPDAYLGADLAEEEVASAMQEHGLQPEPDDGPIEQRIADLLADGYVVARANGRMEYGPRALGNRSILYQPTDPKVNEWLNERLFRTEFMPFAPAVLYEEREKCFKHVAGAEHAAEFMTITFNCTPWMCEHMKGVVHLDDTARPQLVRRDRNPSFYRIIEAFYQRTGLPGIINTSFNMHEEPIVCSAEDCVRAFLQGNLDYLAIGPYLIKHPCGMPHPMRPVAAMVESIAPHEPCARGEL